MNDTPNDRHPAARALDLLQEMLAPTELAVRREGAVLSIAGDWLETRVAAEAPVEESSDETPIAGVVTVRTTLPQDTSGHLVKCVPQLNAFATLAGAVEREGGVEVGSRLTLFEDEGAFEVQFPLLLGSVIGGAEMMVGAFRRSILQEQPESGTSRWSEADIDQAAAVCRHLGPTSSDADGLCIEFPLDPTGRRTALWEVRRDVPHPEAGGGLFCLLQMPWAGPEAERRRLIADLNQLEMEPRDLPPHFGAWAAGQDDGIAYVCFVPNDLRGSHPFIANLTVWASARARAVAGVLSIC